MSETTMTVAREQEPKTETVLGTRRGFVPAMRLAWGALVGLSLTLFALSVPARYAELSEIAHRSSAQLGPGDDLLRGLLLTALVMAALFEPLKRRIDALVERWFYRS